LDYFSNEVDANVCVSTSDGGKGAVVSGGCATQFVGTIDPDRRIEGFLDTSQSQSSFTHAGPWDVVRRAGTGVVGQWIFRGPRSEPGPAELDVTAQLNRVRVVSSDNYGCVSPISYLEARRMHALSAATIRSLDRQLTKSAPGALKVRPRFRP
jgi:hypothetical protein